MTRLRIGMVLAMFASGFAAGPGGSIAAEAERPDVAAGWAIEEVARAPRILFPTAIVAAPDGTLYLGSDPMDMPGPSTAPIDSVVAIQPGGKIVPFAEKLWSVMGLEWADGVLYVVHAPFLSAFRDTNGDGLADNRVDLMTGLGPRLPGASGMNDHIASGLRLGMDGFLYIAVGDKGIPRGVGRDGKTIQLRGGGVIRIRPDGTGLEVVSTGERNPLSVALSASDEVFTYGNDDDSHRWPNSLTHHIFGGHYGYPYEFLAAPKRCLPILGGQDGGAGAQGLCYEEDGLPAEYRGNLFFCDWGRQEVQRIALRRNGATFAIAARSTIVTKGKLGDFRPFSIAVAPDGFWLVDWAYTGWLDPKVQSGRLYRLRYQGRDATKPAPRPIDDDRASLLVGLDHPARSVRMECQRALARMGPSAISDLVRRLQSAGSDIGRTHAIWALDAIGGLEARKAIVAAIDDRSAGVRLQAARSSGIRGDRESVPALVRLLKDRDAAVRREAAIAIGRIGDKSVTPALFAALDDGDRFAAWSIRDAIRRMGAWDQAELVGALLDERRGQPALELTDEAWDVAVARALTEALRRSDRPVLRGRIVENLSGIFRQYPEWSGAWYGPNPLASEPPSKTRNWSPEGMQAIADGLAIGLVDRDAEVRARAIAGLGEVGPDAAGLLAAAIPKEPEPRNQVAIAEALGKIQDAVAIPALVAILSDARRAEPVRVAALQGLSGARDRAAFNARIGLIYDPNAPPGLVAAALPGLAQSGILPPNDLASFLESPHGPIRAAALLSLNPRRELPEEIRRSVLDRLDDKDANVQEAAVLAAVACRITAAVPGLLQQAGRSEPTVRDRAIAALCRLPDPRAVDIYLSALRDPRFRHAAGSALAAVRDRDDGRILAAARSEPLDGLALAEIERALARFAVIPAWRVIGPFPRTTPRLFLGEPRIDFARGQIGAGGKAVAWSIRRAEPSTGRVDLDDLKRLGDSEPGVSSDLAAFAQAEVDSDAEGPALLRLHSSGPMIVTVNERMVLDGRQSAGSSDGELVRFRLVRGRNRILIETREGLGRWSFAAQIARSPAIAGPVVSKGRPRSEMLRDFAMKHEGDPRRGEALFFDQRRLDCARCHSVGGRGTATIGPDLAGIGRKYDRAELVRSVLEPSSRIAVGYQPVSIATRDGRLLSGIVRAETDESIDLADAEARISRLPKRDVEVRKTATGSIMPAGAAEALSPAEFADLISFLAGGKSSAR